MAHCVDAMTIKTHAQHGRDRARKAAVVLVLLLVVTAFYAGSFLLLRG
jgi:hypothetical protein